MGTDIRKMPLTWKHPRDDATHEYIQISTMSYEQALEEFIEDPEEYNGVRPTPEEHFPDLKDDEPFGFMFYSSVSDLPYSDEIFTDRRKMKKWWIYAGRALDAQSQNWNAVHGADLIEGKIDMWFDREDVPPSEDKPITQDEMPRCIVLDGDERKIYAKARKMYKEYMSDDPGCKSDDLDAMFEMFDEWLMDE